MRQLGTGLVTKINVVPNTSTSSIGTSTPPRPVAQTPAQPQGPLGPSIIPGPGGSQ